MLCPLQILELGVKVNEGAVDTGTVMMTADVQPGTLVKTVYVVLDVGDTTAILVFEMAGPCEAAQV